MSARPRDESWTYQIKPPAGVEVTRAHTFDMQNDICVRCKATATDVEDNFVSYECSDAE